MYRTKKDIWVSIGPYIFEQRLIPAGTQLSFRRSAQPIGYFVDGYEGKMSEWNLVWFSKETILGNPEYFEEISK